MRNYLLPAVVCAAIGALVLLLAKRGEKPATPPQPTPSRTAVAVAEPAPESPLGKPAETRTPLDLHKGLREMQRALAGNMAHALDYRHQVCADIDTIAASERLSKDLLETIKQYIDSEDAAKRDVVLPILRIFPNPEATKLIADRYYRAADEAEQMTLLEAMSKPFHDPKQATVWGLDKVMTSPSAEHRERAYDILKTYINDNELLISTSMDVYRLTPDDRQRQLALRTVVERGDISATARDFTRRQLRSPRDVQDVLTMMGYMLVWADEDDAAQLERLADEFPAVAMPLRTQAQEVRRQVAQKLDPMAPDHGEVEKRRKEDMERVEAERKAREAEGAAGDPQPEGD